MLKDRKGLEYIKWDELRNEDLYDVNGGLLK